jgi:hypothetical protein
MTCWKVGDWCVYEMEVGQITRMEGGITEFSTGMFTSAGVGITENLRPLTLRNKALAEKFAYYYAELSKIDGEGGFNYPRIHEHFARLTRAAIDDVSAKGEMAEHAVERAQAFVRGARDYVPVIDGVALFRPKRGVG